MTTFFSKDYPELVSLLFSFVTQRVVFTLGAFICITPAVAVQQRSIYAIRGVLISASTLWMYVVVDIQNEDIVPSASAASDAHTCNSLPQTVGVPPVTDNASSSVIKKVIFERTYLI